MRFWASLLPPQIGCIFLMKSMKVAQDLVLFFTGFRGEKNPENIQKTLKLSDYPITAATLPSVVINEAGFYYQITHGFALEFPYSLIMLPCTIVEWVIRWHIYT